MSTYSESQFEKQTRERERSREAKETGFEMDEQAEAAAAMERADVIVKDIKSTKQQMKNIVMNMHAVRQQIQELRKLLDLVDSGSSTSLEQDQKRIDELKSKIAAYKDELLKMKDELIQEQIADLRNNGETGADVLDRATAKVESFISDVFDDTR